MKTQSFRRTLSLLLTLCMLIGMVAVMGAFPAAAAPTVEKFTANFSALPDGVVQMTDTDTVNYLESRFAFHYYQERWHFERPNVNGYVVDADGNNMTTKYSSATTYLPDVADNIVAANNDPQWVDGAGSGNGWVGFAYWQVSSHKWMSCAGYPADLSQSNRKNNSMWVRSADGDLAKLKNFKLNMEFSPMTADLAYEGKMGEADTLSLFMRSKVEGACNSPDTQLCAFSKEGKFYFGTGETAWNNSHQMTKNNENVTLSSDRTYQLSVTVLGEELQVTISDGADVLLNYTDVMTMPDSGYIGIGGFNAGMRYGSIEVTRLDEAGNEVDFNDEIDGYSFGANFDNFVTDRGKYWTGEAGEYFKNNGQDTKWLVGVGNNFPMAFDDSWYIAKGTSVKGYLEDKFSFYFAQEGNQWTMETPYQTSEQINKEVFGEAINGGACAQWKLTQNGWLTATYNWAGGEILRKTMTLAPKTAGGDFQSKNFETEFDFKIGDTSKTETGVLLTFRSAEAGKITNSGSHNGNSFTDKVTLAFTSKGIGIYDNMKTAYTCAYSSWYNSGMLDANGNPTAEFSFWNGNATASEAHVYVKVVGDTMKLRVTDLATGAVLSEKEITLSRDGSGYLYYTSCNYDTGFANIRLNRLDDSGNVTDIANASSFTLATNAGGEIYAGSDVEAYLKSKVNGYYDNDGTLVSAPFVRTENVGTFCYIYERGFQAQIAHWSNSTHLKAVATMVPKTDDGAAAVLKNFEMTFMTRWAEGTFNGYPNASVVIGGRQQTAGKFTTAAGAVEREQGVIVISPNGITIAAGNDLTDEMYANVDAETFASQLNPQGDLTYYTVKVRVVGSTVTVTIGDKTYTGIWNYDRAGYLAFGVSGRTMQIGDVNITRLDDQGNAVDWNNNTEQIIPNGWTFDAGNLTAYKDATTVAQRTQYLDAFDGAFDVYYNDYQDGTYDYRHNPSVMGNTVGYNYGYLTAYPTGYLWGELNETPSGYGEDSMQRPQTEMRQIGTLVPKDADGDPLYLENFKMHGTLMHHMDRSKYGAHVIGFRMGVPGKYLNRDGSAVAGSHILFTTDSVRVYENGRQIYEKALSATRTDTRWSYDIQVVGNKLTYTFTQLFADNGEVVTDTVNLSATGKGYLGFGQTTLGHLYGMTGMSVTALDAAGNETPIKQPESPYGEGTVTVTEKAASGDMVVSTITVTPNDGYELKAGTLIATDAQGNRYIPERVGFRNGGNAQQYTVTAPSAVKLTMQFIRPTEADPNIGMVGYSVNTELHGLRFVSRLNRTEADGVEYITLDGAKVPVRDYGMLIAAESVVGNGTMLTRELAADNPYVKMLSALDRGVYFDICDEYIDMSVCVTGLDRIANGLSTRLLGRAYVVVEDGSENGKILYSGMGNNTYEKAAGIKTTAFSALNAANQFETIGRAGQVGSEFQMDWVNTGFEISGNLTDEVRVTMTSNRADSLLNVEVDGGAAGIVHVPNGTSSVTLASGLEQGEHTIRVTSGTSVRQGILSATALQYNGSLNTVKNDGDPLRIEVLGDSISCGWGMDLVDGNSYDAKQQVAGSNSYYSYATLAAQALDAKLSVVAQCAQTISEVNGYWKKLNQRSGAPAWDFAANQQDVVIINLGTNDQWRDGYQSASKALTDAKAVLRDVRAAYPNAYIIWAYNMMETYADFEASYLAAVQSMKDQGDNKVYTLKFDKSTSGYEGNHPSRELHAAYAQKLVEFIQNNLGEMFGHTTHTETIGALEAADHVIFNGRTTASGTARTMEYGSTGITLSGYLYGSMTMDVNYGNTSYNDYVLNVVIDGDADHAREIWIRHNGNATVELYQGLGRGYHTVEVTFGTGHCGTLTMKSVTYTGTLNTPTPNPLQIEFIGDSITASDGMMNNCYGSNSMNTFIGYAAKTARILGANVNNVAISGWTTGGMRGEFNNWTGETVQKQIVVINLGTNDFGWSDKPTASTIAGLKETSLGLIADVRAKYGPDTYIIWAYGMMLDKDKDFPASVVEEYRTAHNDQRVLWCDMSSVKNNGGAGGHPDVGGNARAAEFLANYIRTNCADVLS